MLSNILKLQLLLLFATIYRLSFATEHEQPEIVAEQSEGETHVGRPTSPDAMKRWQKANKIVIKDNKLKSAIRESGANLRKLYDEATGDGKNSLHDRVANLMGKAAYEWTADEEFVAKHVPDNQYVLPYSIGGFVFRDTEGTGQLWSPSEAVNALLRYAYAKVDFDEDEENKQKLDNLLIPDKHKYKGCHLQLRLGDKYIRNKVFLFDSAVSISQEEIEEFLERFEMDADAKIKKTAHGSDLAVEDVEDFLTRNRVKEWVKIQKKLAKTAEKERRKGEKDVLKEAKKKAKRMSKLLKKNRHEIAKVQKENARRRAKQLSDVPEPELLTEEIVVGRKLLENVEEDDDDEDEDENYTQVTSYALLDVIQRGRKAFGSNAILQWKSMPLAKKVFQQGLVERILIILGKGIVFVVKGVFYLIYGVLKGTFYELPRLIAHVVREARRDTKERLEAIQLPMVEEKGPLLLKAGEKFHEEKEAVDEKAYARVRDREVDAFEFLQKARFELNVVPGHRRYREHWMERAMKYLDLEMDKKPAAAEIGPQPGPMHKARHYNPELEFTKEEQKKFNSEQKYLVADRRPEAKDQYGNCAQLGELLTALLYPTKPPTKVVAHRETSVAIADEMRGRLGANIMLSVMNAKRFTNGLLAGLFLSMGTTTIIAVVVDVIILAKLVALTTVTGGGAGPLTIPMMIIVPMFVGLVSETIDSLLVKRVLGIQRGKPLFPRSLKVWISNLKEAMVAGGISAIGSSPFIVLTVLTGGWAYLPAKAAANFIGTVTSAAMVPMEVAKMGGHTAASVLMKMEDGFLAKPDTQHIVNSRRIRMGSTDTLRATGAEQMVALQEYIKVKTQRLMRVAAASAMAINSMGTGAMFGFIFGFLMFNIPLNMGLVDESVVEIGSSVFNAPTEAISLFAQTVGSNLGFSASPRLMSTDGQKNEQMVALILLKTVQQLENAKAGRNADLVPINYKEVHRIFRPLLTFTAPLGETIVNTVNKMIQSARITEDLFKKIDTGSLKEAEVDLVVENWRKDVVYVIRRPGTAITPFLSPNDLKLVAWLKFRQTPHYQFTDPLFLNALFAEDLPFVELNGEQIAGNTQQIIDQLDRELPHSDVVLNLQEEKSKEWRQLAKKFPEFVNEKENEELPKDDVVSEAENEYESLKLEMNHFRELIDDILHRMLIYDRSRNVKFATEDVAAIEQWKSAKEEGWRKKMKTVSKRVKNWQKRIQVGARNEMHLRLLVHKLTANGKTLPYAEHADEDLAKVFEETLEQIETRLTENRQKHPNSPFFLFGKKPTPIDASLFAYLIQFLESSGHLNVTGFKRIVEGIKNNREHIFNKFVHQVKEKYWRGGSQGWQSLKAGHEEGKDGKKKRHWPLDLSELDDPMAEDKYKGPFAMGKEDDLIDEKHMDVVGDGSSEDPLMEKTFKLAAYEWMPLPGSQGLLTNAEAAFAKQWVDPPVDEPYTGLLPDTTAAAAADDANAEAKSDGETIVEQHQVQDSDGDEEERIAGQEAEHPAVAYANAFARNFPPLVTQMAVILWALADLPKAPEEVKGRKPLWARIGNAMAVPFRKTTYRRKKKEGPPAVYTNLKNFVVEITQGDQQNAYKVLRAMLHMMAAFLCRERQEVEVSIRRQSPRRKLGVLFQEDKPTCGQSHRQMAIKELTAVSAEEHIHTTSNKLEALLKQFVLDAIHTYNMPTTRKMLNYLATRMSTQLEKTHKKVDEWMTQRYNNMLDKGWLEKHQKQMKLLDEHDKVGWMVRWIADAARVMARPAKKGRPTEEEMDKAAGLLNVDLDSYHGEQEQQQQQEAAPEAAPEAGPSSSRSEMEHEEDKGKGEN